jgi:predicted nucleic acid-binding protein
MKLARRNVPYVVDASVVAAAFFQDEQADACRSVLVSKHTLHAPDLIYPETANVIWKRRLRGEVTEQEAAELLADVLRIPLCITPSGTLVDAALRLALKTERTVYDCLYLALAVQEKAVMVTGDQRLANAMAGGPLEKHIVWIGEED